MTPEKRWNALHPIRGREYWQVEVQSSMGQRFEVLPDKFPSRRQARRGAKRIVSTWGARTYGSSKTCRIVRVVETRFSEPLRDKVHQNKEDRYG